ncbi:hypothetical protein ElyMa_000073900 [Elysia marginata]|uniref:Uncharacterized protein n=1 Tax=Elysia marginata TaxID=1093978 RepID=A0AAV4EHY4_9GAST|nr:hypothetical protein ElyMa_000073900 [Elysia marginata]
MTKYFKTKGSKQRGRPKTSIVATLRRDLKSHNSNHWPTRLHSIKDLDHLRDMAQNRSDWKHLTTVIQITPGRDVCNLSVICNKCLVTARKSTEESFMLYGALGNDEKEKY